MPYDYYFRLSRRQQQIYRASDRIATIAVPDAGALRTVCGDLGAALANADRRATQAACGKLVNDLVAQLNAPRLRVSVRTTRPSHHWGELHGLYEPADDIQPARIVVWMRTAKRRQVVAYKTFLRTLLHEVCHHLDYTHLKLPDSFHTEGFYRRETCLYKAVTGPTPGDLHHVDPRQR